MTRTSHPTRLRRSEARRIERRRQRLLQAAIACSVGVITMSGVLVFVLVSQAPPETETGGDDRQRVGQAEELPSGPTTDPASPVPSAVSTPTASAAPPEDDEGEEPSAPPSPEASPSAAASATSEEEPEPEPESEQHAPEPQPERPEPEPTETEEEEEPVEEAPVPWWPW